MGGDIDFLVLPLVATIPCVKCKDKIAKRWRRESCSVVKPNNLIYIKCKDSLKPRVRERCLELPMDVWTRVGGEVAKSPPR